MGISVFIVQSPLVILECRSFFTLFFSLKNLSFVGYFQMKIVGRNQNHQANYFFRKSFSFLRHYPQANPDFVTKETELLKQQK